jgi:hypothetical protein
VDLDLAMHRIDDPTDEEPPGPADLGGHRTAICRDAVSDLHEPGDLLRTGVAMVLVISGPAPHISKIGLRLAGPPEESHRVGPAGAIPIGRDDPAQCRAQPSVGDGMRRTLGLPGLQIPVDPIATMAGTEVPRGDYGLVLRRRSSERAARGFTPILEARSSVAWRKSWP